MLAIAVAAFHGQALGVLRVLHSQQQLVIGDSIPNQMARAVGLPGVTSDVRLVSRLVLIGTVAWLLWRVWRHGYDWLLWIMTASGAVTLIVIALLAMSKR